MTSDPSLSFKGRSCVAAINELCAKLRNPDCKYLDEISPSAVEDESRRFKVWANNIGAFQGPQKQSSLDYRLREAPQVRQQVVRLLDRLSFSATQASSICAGERPNRVEDDSDLDDETSSDNPQGFKETTLKVSEVRELFLAISGSVTRLFKLSMVIRNPTPRDRYERLASIEPLSSFLDVQHVREKFPEVEKRRWLAERLGKANTQRRDYFRYRRKHKERLAREAEEEHERRLNEQTGPAEKQDSQDIKSTLRRRQAESSLGSTTASTYLPPSTSIKELEESSDTGQSETSYATSVEEDNFKALRVPPPPAEFNDRLPFECPYCYTIQSPTSRQAWKKHVFNDLQPYLCTFESCLAKPFTSRHAWFDHELLVHRKEWVCSLCEHSAFRSPDLFRLHLQGRHHEEVTDRQILTMTDLCEEPLDKLRLEDCPLCEKWASNVKTRELAANPKVKLGMLVVTPVQFRRHLASHLEQLALFALPRSHGGEESSNVDSNDAVIDASSESVSLAELSADGSDSVQEGEIEHSLCHAAATGQADVVRELLEVGADANARDKYHGFALQAAAMFGFDVVVKLLIEHGADVNSPAGPNGTAIGLARSRGHGNTVDLLLKCGADSRHESTSSGQDTIDRERAANFIRKTWRKMHPERSLPLEADSIHHFDDVAWIVYRLWRNRKTGHLASPGPATDGNSERSFLDRIWGDLFVSQGQPSHRLGQLLRSIAHYLIEVYEPQHSIVVGPGKMQRFYRETRIQSEAYAWELVFDDRTSSISRLYREFEIQHHLIQEENRFVHRPDIPGLTPIGFAKLMTVLLDSYPREEKERLRQIVLNLQLYNPDNKEERFPAELPTRLLPKVPNHDLRERLRVTIKKWCDCDESRYLLSSDLPALEQERITSATLEPRAKSVPAHGSEPIKAGHDFNDTAIADNINRKDKATSYKDRANPWINRKSPQPLRPTSRSPSLEKRPATADIEGGVDVDSLHLNPQRSGSVTYATSPPLSMSNVGGVPTRLKTRERIVVVDESGRRRVYFR